MSNVPLSPPSLPNEAPVRYTSVYGGSTAASSGLQHATTQQQWGPWDSSGVPRPTGPHSVDQHQHPPPALLPYPSSGPSHGQYSHPPHQHQYNQDLSHHTQPGSHSPYPALPSESYDPATSVYMPAGPPQPWSNASMLPPSSGTYAGNVQNSGQNSGYHVQLSYDPTVPRSVPPIDLSVQSVGGYYGPSSTYGVNGWQQPSQQHANVTVPSHYPDPLTLVPQFRRRSISAPSALDSVLVGLPGARTSPTRVPVDGGTQAQRNQEQQQPPPSFASQSQSASRATASDASDSPPFSLLSPGAQIPSGGPSHGANSHGLAPLGYGPAEGIVLKTGMKERPPYPLSTLIAYAIATSRARRLTLQEIYAWLLSHYPYYANATTNWRNTVRHTLSTSSAFVKQEKSLSDFGKGAFWTLDPNKADKVLKKARRSSDPYRSGANAPSKDRRYRATSSRPDLDSSGATHGSTMSALPTDNFHRSFVASGNASAPTRATPLRQMIRRPSGPISDRDPSTEPVTAAVPLEPPAQPQYPTSSFAPSTAVISTSSAAEFLHQSWSGGLSRTSTGTGTTLSTSTSLDSLGSLPAQPGDPVVAAEISQLFSAAALSTSEPFLPSFAEQQNAQTPPPSGIHVRDAPAVPHSAVHGNPPSWIPPSTASLDSGLLGLMQQVEQHQQHPDLPHDNAYYQATYADPASSYSTHGYPSQAATPQMPQLSLTNSPPSAHGPPHTSPHQEPQ